MNINNDIPGWMTMDELAVIAKISSMVPDDGLIVELGSYCGRSSWAWQFNMPASAKLDLVDVWNETEDFEERLHLAHGSDEYKKIFTEFMHEHSDGSAPFHAIAQFLPKDDRVTKYRGDVMDYVVHTPPSVVFIDAEHTFDAVDADIGRYKHYPDCLLMGHDFASYATQVAEAVLKNVDRRTLIVPKGCSIWMLLPNTGYWVQKFQTVIGDLI